MSLKDKWTPQDITMDASPDIPNMLADAIIQNEEAIKKLAASGGNIGIFNVLITLNEDGTVTSEISDNDVVEAINSGKIVAADITYKSATIRVYDVVRGDYGVLFSFQAESEIVSVYTDNGQWTYLVDVIMNKNYVDSAIQSAIYDSWGNAV